MKLWIVGAQGAVGSVVARIASEKGIEAVATSREQADITSWDALCRAADEIQPTHIINCAAYTDVDKAETEPDLAYAINATGVAHLGRIAKRDGVKMVHLSTDYVFDGKGNSPYQESDQCAPVNVYGKTKREGELLLQEAFPAACILRTSWLFGIKNKNFISSIFRLLSTQSEIQVVADQMGRPTCCGDLARVIFSLLECSSCFHFANEGAMSRYEIAKTMREAALRMGRPVACQNIIPVSASAFPTVAQRPSYSVLDTKKIEQITGPIRHWSEALFEHEV